MRHMSARADSQQQPDSTQIRHSLTPGSDVTSQITLQERRSVRIDSAAAELLPTTFWSTADCTIHRAPGDDAWTLTAGDSVGVTRMTTSDVDVTLTITPKLPDGDVFFLADYAFDQRHDPLRVPDFDTPALEAVHADPTAALLLWHVNTINRFAARWLARDYRTTDHVFSGKVRGRILLDRYVKNHLAIGAAHHIPCRTLERTEDTPNNRILKAGLRYVAALSHTLTVPAAGAAVRQHVAAALPRYAQVADITATPAALRDTTTRGPQRHYAHVLNATRTLLARQFTDLHAGTLRTQSFLWQMPILFQEAVRGILTSLPDIDLDNGRPPTASVTTMHGQKLRTSKVDPDLVLHTAGGATILLDTKYKNVLAQSGPSAGDSPESVMITPRHRITVSRADIYQAVAYRHHDRWSHPTTTSGLLFPVSLPADVPLPDPHYVHGFGQTIPLLFIDIGPRARQNLPHFRAALQSLSSQPAGVQMNSAHS